MTRIRLLYCLPPLLLLGFSKIAFAQDLAIGQYVPVTLSLTLNKQIVLKDGEKRVLYVISNSSLHPYTKYSALIRPNDQKYGEWFIHPDKMAEVAGYLKGDMF